MKVYKVVALWVLTFFCSTVLAQGSEYKGFPSLTWPKLYTIDYRKEKDDLGEYDRPIFSAQVKALQGRIISVYQTVHYYHGIHNKLLPGKVMWRKELLSN